MPHDRPKRCHEFDIIAARVRSLPRVAITVGDPAGIGPEIAEKAANDARVRDVCEPVIFAPPASVTVPLGQPTAESGRAAYDLIVRAVDAAKAGDVDAIATAPISKLAFAYANIPWKGHTDLLAHLCASTRYAMLFHSPKLIVTLATVHIPLGDVPRELTEARLGDAIALTDEWLRDLGIAAPRVAVAGLNPHAGEAGVLGSEDEGTIAPAIAAARVRGIDASGPYPGDTVFLRASRGEFDAVVAAYHDQGLIPVKLISFGHAVNVTVGLPIIRTSVDHGTAYDIAGRCVADPQSMIAAVMLAAELASRRHARG
jgi:4-hydroxythreonine-4-phosphate dehydrogenase